MNGVQKLWDEPLCRALRRRIGRALGRYRMITEGNRIVVGLSGGKDSLLLLHALSDLRRRSPVRFELATGSESWAPRHEQITDTRSVKISATDRI